MEQVIPGVDDAENKDDKENDNKEKQKTDDEEHPRLLSTSLIRSWYICYPTVRNPIT